MDDKTGLPQQQWYYCLKHNRVEGEEGCPNSVRMGPYDSEEAAANALETARERNDAWDAADKEWKDG